MFNATKKTKHKNMAKITEVRLTLAAFIYSIEIDLKNVIKQYITPFQMDLGFFQDAELIDKVVDRFNRDNPKVKPNENIDDVIDYIDFHDTFIILKKNNVFLSKQSSNYLNSIHQVLSDITQIRNRVMHTRPLLGGDFSFVFEFVQKLKQSDPINWKLTIETRNSIEQDPSYLLTVNLPKTSIFEPISSVIHNLPAPDFDDTGFIGRTKDAEDVKKLIVSNKVVSILGDGGIGKTALAVKVAYDFVDMGEKCPFELIIWTTAKTTMLTSRGIEEIYSAITDYTGLVDVISNSLKVTSDKDKLSSILEYLDVFKTLLIIDNLETIQSEEVRNFIRLAQTKCNIVITSRIGLGELEYPKTLLGLSETECAKLIREVARIRNSDILIKLPQTTLIEIASTLFFNPLALKWFVETVEMGITPKEVLNNKDDLLNFCLTNVYGKLSEGAISILNTIRASRRKLSSAEILYLSDYEPLQARKYLIELFKTTLIRREIQDTSNLEEVYYYIPDFAREFLSHSYTVNQEFIKKITEKSRKLTSGVNEIKKVNSYNEFSLNALTCETSNQRIAAKLLSEALSFSKIKKYKEAFLKINEAKNVDPSYFEVYRVSAFLKASSGDTLSAEDDYLIGLEIAPDNLRLLYYYAQFLLFQLEDTQKALKYAEQVYLQKPNHPMTAFLFARCYNVMKEFNKAIQIIKNLIHSNELDASNLRIAYTTLISLYSNFGENYFKVENDTEQGINHFKKSFATFRSCVKKDIIDYKMLKNFSDAFYKFITLIPTTEIEKNKEYTQKVLLEFQKQLQLVSYGRKIILKYYDKFNDDQFNYVLDLPEFEGVKIGNIIKVQNDSYLFIDSEGKRFFAHFNDFIEIDNINNFKKIREGQLVSFEIGTNDKGVCAKKVKAI